MIDLKFVDFMRLSGSGYVTKHYLHVVCSTMIQKNIALPLHESRVFPLVTPYNIRRTVRFGTSVVSVSSSPVNGLVLERESHA